MLLLEKLFSRENWCRQRMKPSNAIPVWSVRVSVRSSRGNRIRHLRLPLWMEGTFGGQQGKQKQGRELQCTVCWPIHRRIGKGIDNRSERILCREERSSGSMRDRRRRREEDLRTYKHKDTDRHPDHSIQTHGHAEGQGQTDRWTIRQIRNETGMNAIVAPKWRTINIYASAHALGEVPPIMRSA